MTTTPSVQTAARTLLDGLAVQDFDLLGEALADGVRLRALLPADVRVLDGRDPILEQFEAWFGDVDTFEFVDSSVSALADRTRISWTLRVQSQARFGDGSFLVEQEGYAKIDDAGLIAKLDIVCSGFRREVSGD